MRVLIAHNAYQQRGGEDVVAEAEAQLLREHGHEVLLYTRHNDELAQMGRLQAAADTLWSRRTTRELGALLREQRPDVVHVHNTFPLISPSLYSAAHAAGVPVVQTLHNFRLLCPQAMLLREGKVCEDCVGRAPWPAVRHACYRGSRAQSGVLAGMLVLHRALGTWQDKVQRYIALNDFCRDKFIKGGLPAARIAVKPNFVELPEFRSTPARDGLLFAGRLSPEKGIAVLAKAAKTLAAGSLRVAGHGPQESVMASCEGAVMLGHLSRQDLRAQMLRSIALIVPSIWYETFGLVVIEAFACGVPVIASRIGVLADLVEDGVTGILVKPGDWVDLAAKMQWAISNRSRMSEMGQEARRRCEAKYSAVENYRQLIQVYDDARGVVDGA